MTQLRDGRTVNLDSYVEGYRYNAYRCPSHHVSLAVEIDEGVTPMFLRCRRMVGIRECGERASSMMYPRGEPGAHLFPVQIVWRKATKGELRRERKEKGDHYSRGGLALEWHHR